MTLRSLPFFLILAALAALTAAPLFLVDVVPMLDYPAHLARVALIAQQPLDPIVAARYAVDIRPLANLGLDLAVPPLARLVGPAIALKLFITLGIALWLVGAALIYRALWRHWALQPLLAAFFVVNTSFNDGYINFFVAAGLALVAAGLWLGRERKDPLFLLAMAAVAVILLICHLMALAIFLMLIATFDLGRHLARLRAARAGELVWGSRHFREAAPVEPFGLVRDAAAVAVVALPALLLWAFVLERGLGGGIRYNWLANALALAIYSSTFAGIGFNALPAAAVLAALAIAVWTRRAAIAWAAVPALAVTALAMLLMPVDALGGAGLQVRLPPIVMILLLATVRVRRAERWLRPAAAALVIIVALGAAVQTARWWGPAAAIGRFQDAVTAHLPEGARLATVLATRADDRFWHAADLMIPRHKLFVPAFFTVVGQSTIRLKPAYAGIGALTAAEGASLMIDDAWPLLAPAPPPLTEAERIRLRPYLDLPCAFDAVVLFGAPPDATPLPPTLTALARDPAFTLYRVTPPAGRACPAR